MRNRKRAEPCRGSSRNCRRSCSETTTRPAPARDVLVARGGGCCPSEAASGLQLAGLETGVPVAFGVLTCDNEQQARERLDKAGEAVRTALEMADVFSQLRAAAGAAPA